MNNMYTFLFTYFTGDPIKYSGIIKVEQFTGGRDVNPTTGDEILTHNFLLNYDLHLLAEGKSYKVSSSGLKSIEIEKEKS